MSPASLAPQTSTESYPAPQFSSVPKIETAPPEELPKVKNECLLGLYFEGVPFARYKDLKIVSIIILK